MSQFREHYAQLSDEALIELALTRELLPEAETALNAELTARGIRDLSTHRAVRQAEAMAEEKHRQAQIASRVKVIGWRTKVLYVGSLLACSYGAFRLAAPNKENPGDDGGIMLVLGIAMFFFALVTSRLSKFWSERVLHRPPPP